jgi:catechol 2,3-dioxygenase-like lactoylglutathione lyase family enzyme
VKVLALDHVQLAMPRNGEEDAIRFYVEVLGMRQVPKPEPMRASGGVWFRAGEAELHLGVEDPFRPSSKAHPALRVDDLDTFATHCEAAGHPIEWDTRYPGIRRFYVRDPFGNRIEILAFDLSAQPTHPPD